MKLNRFTLLLTVILGACAKPGPEEVLREYLGAISTGKCEQAKDLCTAMAKDFVQGMIDLGCQPYESEIHAVQCTIEGDAALCECDETNPYGRFLLYYHMQRVEGDWKVHIEAQTDVQTKEE